MNSLMIDADVREELDGPVLLAVAELEEREEQERPERVRQPRRRVGTVVRVAAALGEEEERFIGEVLIQNGRVRRHATSVPSEVVLKLLVQHTRQGETCGKVIGRKDGRAYYWHVVGADGVDD